MTEPTADERLELARRLARLEAACQTLDLRVEGVEQAAAARTDEAAADLAARLERLEGIVAARNHRRGGRGR